MVVVSPVEGRLACSWRWSPKHTNLFFVQVGRLERVQDYLPCKDELMSLFGDPVTIIHLAAYPSCERDRRVANHGVPAMDL